MSDTVFTGRDLYTEFQHDRQPPTWKSFDQLEDGNRDRWNRLAGHVNAEIERRVASTAADGVLAARPYSQALTDIAVACGNSGILLGDPGTVTHMVSRELADRDQAYTHIHAIYQAAFGEPADGGLPPGNVADAVIGQIRAFREQEVHRSEADAARAAALVEEARSQLEQVRTNAAAQIAEMRAELAGALPEPDPENPGHIEFAAAIAYNIAKRTGKVDPSRWLADEASRLATKRNRRDASIAHCLTLLQKAGIPNPDAVAAALVDSDLVLIEGDGEPPMMGARP
ncbi:hypothetical protein SEA_ALEEMILY_68 [Gordonia phage Aleemily]|uniref:Uncharacterized protein n=1 Tax=Gordonia phage Aleemily TaxID=2965181 RepID=A0A9E7QBL0_9CAUD|nr:hypothetical protein SEA_ALEEMILY_68 [Gordonia phage Aleemily]